MFKKIYELDLQLFAEGGAEGATGMSAQSDSGASSLSEVVYGTQTEQVENGSFPENQTVEPSVDEDLDAEFAGLIKKDGKFGKQYQKVISKHLGERTKNLTKQKQEAEKAHQEYSNSVNPLVESLAARYGVDPKDISAIQNAINDDADFFESAAVKAGMSTTEYKSKLENDRLRNQMRDMHQREADQKRVQGWLQEAEQLKAIYPDLNLEQELTDPAFASLLANGFPMKRAYETVHLDEILSNTTYQVAQSIEDKVANNMKENNARPIENGVSSQSASRVVRNSVSDLSYDDMDEIDRQVRSGKKVTFRK